MAASRQLDHRVALTGLQVDMMETREPGALTDEDPIVVFLLDLGRALHLAYQPAPIVEARVKRAAQAWGLQVRCSRSRASSRRR